MPSLSLAYSRHSIYVMHCLSYLTVFQGLGQSWSSEPVISETETTFAVYWSSKVTEIPLFPLDSAFFDKKISYWVEVVLDAI